MNIFVFVKMFENVALGTKNIVFKIGSKTINIIFV